MQRMLRLLFGGPFTLLFGVRIIFAFFPHSGDGPPRSFAAFVYAIQIWNSLCQLVSSVFCFSSQLLHKLCPRYVEWAVHFGVTENLPKLSDIIAFAHALNYMRSPIFGQEHKRSLCLLKLANHTIISFGVGLSVCACHVGAR